MPNIKSAVKRMRQNDVRRLRNRSRRSAMRSQIKRYRQLIQDGQKEQAQSMLPAVYAIIDRTAQKGAIRANTAARYKSRLTKQLALSN
ncbi:MAG: 30S ribosomal protein S20 [Acidobacteriota bacterium]|nr:MAG: 30S ribosomal protein S20 [Acidobacteriota bacterium]